MLGRKERTCKVHRAICLEDLVPEKHFYRQVEAKLNLSFVRNLVKDSYAQNMGRPSIDPVVFFKLQLIMFFEGIRSERQLMEMVNVNLAHRWYLGYDLDEAVPDHSSLTKIRDRYGLEVFERFFEAIVELCIAAGLVWGKELYFDGTKVRGNADSDKQVPRFYWQAQQHLQALFSAQEDGREASGSQAQENKSAQTPEQPRDFLQTYDGKSLCQTPPHTERKADGWVCPTDPDASPLRGGRDGTAQIGYHTHYVVDGGTARIILAVLVTPASVQDNSPMLDLERWVRFRFHLHPEIGVGDSKYGTTANIVGLESDGLHAYVATPDLSTRAKVYPPERFTYDPDADVYTCPQGQTLYRSTYRASQQDWTYRAPNAVCRACPVRAECTTAKEEGRRLYRSIYQDYLDKVDAYHQTEAYKKAMRKRMVWVEPLFGEAKQFHQLNKFRLRRLIKVNIEAILKAAGQNIKRLLKPRHGQKPLPPAVSAALAEPAASPAELKPVALLPASVPIDDLSAPKLPLLVAPVQEAMASTPDAALIGQTEAARLPIPASGSLLKFHPMRLTSSRASTFEQQPNRLTSSISRIECSPSRTFSTG